MTTRNNRWTAWTVAIAGLLALPGCDYLDDQFSACRDLRVDLENRGGSGEPVNLIQDGENYADFNLVPWLASRRVLICAERGDAKRFRAGRGNETLFIAHCVVSRSTDEFEAVVARVVWDRGELACENW